MHNPDANITMNPAPQHTGTLDELFGKTDPLRAQIAGMAEHMAKAPRRFERGFQTDFSSLQDFCTSHGFTLGMDRGWYTLRKNGEKGRPVRMNRREMLRRIDEFIRIPAGLQPIMGD